jgi:hypothetical protein
LPFSFVPFALFCGGKFPPARFLLPFQFHDWQAARAIMNRLPTIARREPPLR